MSLLFENLVLATAELKQVRAELRFTQALAEDRRSRAKAAEADATASRLEMFAAKRSAERWKKAAAYYRYKDQVAAKLASSSLKQLTEERDHARQWAGLWKKVVKRLRGGWRCRPLSWWYPADIYMNKEGVQ